jgi:hypothetical protein
VAKCPTSEATGASATRLPTSRNVLAEAVEAPVDRPGSLPRTPEIVDGSVADDRSNMSMWREPGRLDCSSMHAG